MDCRTVLRCGMNNRMTTLERTFELARSGKFATVSELKQAVASEGYSMAQVTGSSLTKQLRELIAAHRQPAE